LPPLLTRYTIGRALGIEPGKRLGPRARNTAVEFDDRRALLVEVDVGCRVTSVKLVEIRD